MERVRVEEFEESLCKDCGWVNLVFFYGFSQNSLWKLSIFRGYKGYLYLSEKGMWRVNFSITEWTSDLDSQLATWLSRESKPRANWMASLDFLSCSATVGMVVQLLCMLHSCTSSGGLQAASHPRDPAASRCFTAQSWAFFHTLSHTTLTWFPLKLNIGLLIAKLQANLT